MTVKLPPGVSLGPVPEGGVIADSEWGQPVFTNPQGDITVSANEDDTSHTW